MGFFEDAANKGKKQEEIKNLKTEIIKMVRKKESLFKELENMASYREKLVDFGNESMSKFSSYFRFEGFKVFPEDPREHRSKVAAESGEFKFTLTHRNDGYLDFQTKGYSDSIELYDNRDLGLKFNGFIDIDGIFLAGSGYAEETKILEQLKIDIQDDLQKLNSLLESSYVPEVTLKIKGDVFFININEYLSYVEETLAEKYEQNVK